MKQEKKGRKMDSRFERRRVLHYGWYVIGLSLFLCISSFPPVSSWFQNHLWPTVLFWGILLAAAWGLLPQVHVPGHLHWQGTVQGYAWSGAGVYLAIRYGIGIVLKDLAASPYDHSLSGLTVGLSGYCLSLAFREYVRTYGIRALCRHGRLSRIRTSLFMGLFTIFLALTEIPFQRLQLVQDGKSLFFFVVQQVLPAFAESGVLSCLVYFGGWKAGLIWCLAPAVFLRVFPFLPQLPWLAEAALDLAYPAVFGVWVRENLETEHGEGTAGSRNKSQAVRSFAALGVAVACCWFCVGVFPVYPSVVLTGSMEPGIYPGDVVLIRRLTKEQEVYELKETDVINFSREDYTITHRICGVLRDEAGNVSFRTRGDNNPSEDAQAVQPNDVNGIVVGVVPKAGMGVLLLKGEGEAPEGVMTGGENQGV